MLEEELTFLISLRGMYGPGGRGGGGGAAGPPQIFELPPKKQGKIWAKPVFKDVFMFFFFNYHYFFYVSCIFYPEVGVIFELHSHETVVV